MTTKEINGSLFLIDEDAQIQILDFKIDLKSNKTGICSNGEEFVFLNSNRERFYKVIAQQYQEGKTDYIDGIPLFEVVEEDKFKIEYQQYPDGTHICIAYQNGDWVCDLGKEGNKDCEDNAFFLLNKLNQSTSSDEDVEKLAKDYLFEDYAQKYSVKTNDVQFGVIMGFKAGFQANQPKREVEIVMEDSGIPISHNENGDFTRERLRHPKTTKKIIDGKEYDYLTVKYK